MSCCKPNGMPHWTAPAKDGKFLTGLFLNNSMTREKTEFVPNKDRTVTWYGCGPTVYDASHMGHARTYVSVDIMQRIFADYFGYNLQVCMNITDVEDKIIKRSVEQGITFEELSRNWETEFFKDMNALNVRLPDVITRVSEYIPEIVGMIEKIISNGYGYESNGNVYFDVEAFRANPEHFYARMEPKSAADATKAMEGEGDLGEKGKKKNNSDFALWKKAKGGEPFWTSPWGNGRPGWHIECSAMATEILGFPIDIHSGGIDLRFPHHDNELAQSEAFANQGQWVNYFLHTGHLNIAGLKMSKSLKNFITIRAVLAEVPAKYIRLLCLTSKWDADMNYNPHRDGEGNTVPGSSLNEAGATDKKFVEFFRTVKGLSRAAKVATEQRWREEDRELDALVMQTRDAVHAALLDNLDTAAAMRALLNLVSKTNVYINSTPVEQVRLPVVRKAASYILKMLNIFGLTNNHPDSLTYEAATLAEGYSAETSSSVQADNVDLDAVVGPVVEAVSRLRADVKAVAQQSQDKDLAKTLFGLCDKARDVYLAEAGIKLVDAAAQGGSASWSRASPEELKAQLASQQADEAKKAADKAAKEEAKKAKAAEEQRKKDAVACIEPAKFFQTAPQFQGRFAAFDENGFPTVALDNGKETPISAKKVGLYQKELEKHTAAHNEWKARTQQ